MKNDETIFILSNQNNYYDKIKCSYSEILLSYCNLINFYVSYSIENMNIKDKEIFYTGLRTIQHVFRMIMFYTKNLELTNYNTQQSIYYYVEYISQITDKEDNIFFNLSIKDAVIYVYTRTIFELKKHFHINNSEREIDIFANLTCLTNNYNKIITLISFDLFQQPITSVKEKLANVYCLFEQIDHDNNNILDNLFEYKYKTCVDHLESLISK